MDLRGAAGMYTLLVYKKGLGKMLTLFYMGNSLKG
jgi:hypothetical protein